MSIFLKLHLITIIPVLILGPLILLRKRGDKLHMISGRIWASLMILSCLLTFGITNNGRYSWLHGLAVFTMFQIVRAIRAVRRGDLRIHQRAMIGSYLGTLVAFIFAIAVPGRLLNTGIHKIFQDLSS
jgi:uncharacterized membrane protein